MDETAKAVAKRSGKAIGGADLYRVFRGEREVGVVHVLFGDMYLTRSMDCAESFRSHASMEAALASF